MKKLYMTAIALMGAISMHAQGWPADYEGVMLQGFYWDSYRASKWQKLEAQADDLAPVLQSGMDSAECQLWQRTIHGI